MHLPETLNAPRICWLGGKVYFVRAISLEGMAIILAWLDDVIPGREDRETPPFFGSPEAQKELEGPLGQTLLTWVALREQGISFDEVMAIDSTDQERLRLMTVLFGRRRALEIDREIVSDIAETWCGKGLAEMASQAGMERVRALSLDQFEWIASEGDIDPANSPESKGFKRAMEMFKDAKANGAEEVTLG